MSSRSVRGLTVVITGGARGIGLATAKELHGAGARVTIGDVDGDLAAQRARDLGADVVGCHVDITDAGSLARLVETAEAAHGGVDVMINNAGIMPIGPFLEEGGDVVRRVMAVNVGGTMAGMKAVLPGMVGRGSGHVVNVASVAGTSPVPGGASYAASKAAVISMTESVRVEFAGCGVDFTCVMPSFTNTDLIAGTRGTKLIKNVEPDDVARAIRTAIERRSKDVYVPRSLALVVGAQGLLGRWVRDRLNHLIGADSTFLEVDREARRHYDDRIGDAGGDRVSV